MTQPLPQLAAAYQPQQWIDDNAVDSEPARAFDAGPVLLSLDAYGFRKMDAEIRKDHGRDLDLIAEVAGQAVTRGHTGPFEVRIEREDYLAWLDAVGFDPHDIAAIDDSIMEKMRAEHGVKASDVEDLELFEMFRPFPRPAAATSRSDVSDPARCVVANVPLLDWRIGDGTDEELTEVQKQPRTVTIVKPGDHRLIVEFDNPDGSRHVVGIEIDQGNARLIVYPRDQDEVGCIVSLTETGLHVAAGGEDQNFLLGEDNALIRTSGPAAASFAGAPTPKP